MELLEKSIGFILSKIIGGKLNISIFGLGYVGCVSLGCLAEMDNNVIGVDVSKVKVELINNGKATIVEKDIDNLIIKGLKDAKISATLNSSYAILNSDIAIICVGTPNNDEGHLNMKYIYNVAEEIGRNLKEKEEFFVVSIRSTVMPGTNEKVGSIIENVSGKKNNIDFGVVSNPEFLREGSAVEDFFNPPYTVIASASVKALNTMKELYSKLSGDVINTEIGVAELIKFVNNTFHALKVAFTNEIGRISKSLNIDSYKLMELFVKDNILNISPYYFKPGFSYGGSCLPKDLKALTMISHDHYLKTPIIDNIELSNKNHLNHVYNLLVKAGKKRIGIYGLSFKKDTDDMRFSPSVELAEMLLGKGHNVIVYDKNVSLSKILGKNKEYLDKHLPHIERILKTNLNEFLDFIDILLIVNKDDKLLEIIANVENNFRVIDITHVSINNDNLNYEGVCW